MTWTKLVVALVVFAVYMDKLIRVVEVAHGR